jgi:hypothetical protein
MFGEARKRGKDVSHKVGKGGKVGKDGKVAVGMNKAVGT